MVLKTFHCRNELLIIKPVPLRLKNHYEMLPNTLVLMMKCNYHSIRCIFIRNIITTGNIILFGFLIDVLFYLCFIFLHWFGNYWIYRKHVTNWNVLAKAYAFTVLHYHPYINMFEICYAITNWKSSKHSAKVVCVKIVFCQSFIFPPIFIKVQRIFFNHLRCIYLDN